MSDNNSETSTTTNDFDLEVRYLIEMIHEFSSAAVEHHSNGDLNRALACTRCAKRLVNDLEELTDGPVYGIGKVA